MSKESSGIGSKQIGGEGRDVLLLTIKRRKLAFIESNVELQEFDNRFVLFDRVTYE